METSKKQLESALQKYTNETTFLEVPLIKKEAISHDSYIFTFELPEKDLVLGTKAGEFIRIQ